MFEGKARRMLAGLDIIVEWLMMERRSRSDNCRTFLLFGKGDE